MKKKEQEQQPSPSEKVKIYLDTENKQTLSSSSIKRWEKEFKQYIVYLLGFVYGQEKAFLIKMCIDGDESFMNMFTRAFTDQTESVINNEPLEFFGDNVFNYVLSKYLYVKYNTDIKMSSPEILSRIENYYKSNEYQEIMAENLGIKKWILKGNKYVNLTKKMKANLVESLFGAIDFVTRGVRALLCSKKEYEVVCTNNFGIDACYIFLKNYFEEFGFNPEDSEKNTAVMFFNTVTDNFTERGKIIFIKEKIGGKDIFHMEIKKDFAELLKREKGLSDEQFNTLLKVQSLKSESKNDLANDIKKIFEKKLGVTEDWIEEYKMISKINTIPEPYKTELVNKVKGEGERFVNIKFEAPITQRTYKETTMIMYRVKGDEKGNIIDKEILGILTGPHNGAIFPQHLKLELVKKYLGVTEKTTEEES